MASTSKFLQLTPQILVEYIYRDQLTPEIIDTDTNGARINILNDSYTNTNFLFNEDNPFISTGNTRVLSAIPVLADKSKYAYLTTNTALQYLDFDKNLISISEYQSQLTGIYNIPSKQIEYDNIKVHLISGFNFFENDGILFEVLVRDRAGKKHNLTSLVFLKPDNYEIINPKPLMIGERLYTKYLSLKVPSLDWMTNEYLVAPNNTMILANQLTNNIGLLTQSTIELSVKFIVKTELINAQTYFYIGESSSAVINKTDEYSLLSAVVQESISGDYFEIFGEYNGDIYEDFIFQLNQQPNTNIIVMHDINVFEQVGTNFLLTTEQSFIQTNDFGEPYVFRPIILNSHIAVSYRIDYSMRLINKVDNSQIIKQSQFSSFDVKKFGRRIRKINMGTVPIVTKIYNILPSDTNQITINNPAAVFGGSGKVIKETQFVIGFRERLKISASVSSVKVIPSELQEGDITPTEIGAGTRSSGAAIEIKSITPSENIWSLGEAIISVSPFDNFILFVMYDNTLQEATGSKQPQLLDLTNMGTFYLLFKDETTGDELRVSNYTNVKDLSPIKGELLFKITKEEANKILKYNSRNFYVSSRLELNDSKSDETLVYFGKWYKVDEKIQVRDSETIDELNKKILVESTVSESTVSGLNSHINTLVSKNSELTEENNNLKRSLSQASDMLLQYNKTQADTVKQLVSGTTKNISATPQISPTVKSINKKIESSSEKFISESAFNSLKGKNIKNIKL